MNALFRYKDIIFYRTLAGLKSEARKNYLGYIWFILEPLMSTAVLYFAMSHLTGQRGTEAVLTILLGMIAWQWFEGSVMLSTFSIEGKYHIHQQVPLPKYLFPMVDVGTNTVRFIFAFTIILAGCLVLKLPPLSALVWLPLVLLLQFAFIISGSLLFSITVTVFRDLRFFIQSLFRLLFFVSGIFFTASRVPANMLPYFHANPLSVFIESYRHIILDGVPPDPRLLLGTLPLTFALLAVGAAMHVYMDKRLLKLINV